MRKIEQKLLIGLVDAAAQGLKYAVDIRQADLAADVLADCFSAFETLGRTIGRNVSTDRSRVYLEMVNRIEDCFRMLREGMADGGQLIGRETARQAESCLFELKDELLEEKEIQYIVLFLPYKASMWDSMDTIWESASKDSRCMVYVSPIPYFDRKPDHSFGQMHYEGDLFPEYIDVIDYRCLNLESLRPDVIYIHNPYDQYNYVTSIAPAFYSKELKKYTDQLVYVSYFIPGVYQTVEGAAAFCQTTGMFYADTIIAQSQIHKQLLVANGNAADKIAVLGNPKLDYVLKYAGSMPGRSIPDEWKKLSGWKTVLLCMSIGSFLQWDKIIEMYDVLIEFVMSHDQAAVLFRPHPLLEAAIQSMRPSKYQQYMELLDKYKKNDRFVLDNQADSILAIQISGCMISDYSSLCFSYAVTGKPVAIMIHSSLPSDDYFYAFDYRGSYFIRAAEYFKNTQIPQGCIAFIEDFLNGRDPQMEERLARIENSVVNADGTSGRNIHAYVMEQIK